jgi:uncharacterized membrane protein (UPF0127 family)
MFERITVSVALSVAVACCVGVSRALQASAAPASIAALECANARLPVSILDGTPARSEGAALKTIVVRAPKATLHLAVAASEKNRELGLMCVVRLRERGGMIFDFGYAERWEFWMKNTLIPLDMIWVGQDGTVSGVAASVPASTMQTTDQTVARRSGYGRYVIELRAGEARRDGIVTGTKLTLPPLGGHS